MAYSKYYTDYQAPQSQRQDMSALMQKLRELQQQSQQQQQQNMSPSNMQNIGKLGKSIFGGGSPTSFGGQQGGVGGSYLSGDAGLGMDLGGTAGQGTNPSWYSSLFSSPASGGAAGGGGASSGLMSNPWTAAAAAIIGSANVMHNKDISPWSDSIKGKAGGNLVDYYGEGGHGIGSKIFDKDGAIGQNVKGFTDIMEFDPKNAIKNLGGGLKSLFKGKLF